MIPHCIFDDDVVLYALGELEGERREHLEAHVVLCPECQKRIDQFRQVRRHLAGFTRTAEIAGHRDALKRRILAEASGPPPQPVHSRQRGRIWRWQPALLVVLVLAAAIALASTAEVAGHFPFAHFVGLSSDDVQYDIEAFISTEREPPGISFEESLEARDTGLPVPEDLHIPEELPLGLYLVRSQLLVDGHASHYYASREFGLEIAITVGDAGSARTSIPQARAMLASVNGIDVLIDRNSSRDVNGLLWLDGDLLYNIAIVRAFGGLTITPEQLMSVAEAIMRASAGQPLPGSKGV